MNRSVLLVSDQEAGRFPECCVLSGAPTARAVRVLAVRWRHARWLLGIPGLAPVVAAVGGRRRRYRVALPVSATVWMRWRRRNLTALCVLAAGLAFVAAGIVRGDGGIGVLGGIPALVATAYRTRAVHNYWLTCTLDTQRRTIVVRPTHPAFDRQARMLFDRSLHRR